MNELSVPIYRCWPIMKGRRCTKVMSKGQVFSKFSLSPVVLNGNKKSLLVKVAPYVSMLSLAEVIMEHVLIWVK